MIRLALRVRSEHAEVALAELLGLAPAGVEEVDLGDGTIEYAVYGAPGELPALPALEAAAGAALVEVRTSEVPDDWSERWREFHRPVLIGSVPGSSLPSLHIRPPWEPPPEDGRVVEIVIDPGQAFGTGSHHSTRLCLELLLALAGQGRARGALVDVGCGSGVLAIAAARLGWHPVIALDNDPLSVQAASDNAAANAVEIDVRRCDLRREELPRASTIVANLLRPLLLALPDAIAAAPDQLLASGLLAGEVDEVAEAFGDRLSLRERERRSANEWFALWLSAAQLSR